MSTESAFLRFRAFMTPGRTLSAMLFLFIALPSVVVWSGVASFGAGKGAGATSGEGEGKETAKTVSDLDVASAKAKALMSSAASAASGAGGGSGGGGDRSDEKDAPKPESKPPAPNLNPIVVKAPMGNVVGSGSNAATQGADQVQAKPPAGPSAAQSLPAGATATSKAQQATQSAAALQPR